MEISFGFCIIIFLILIPGLIFRRLYFFDQFSKEFNSNHSLASLLAISVVPGLFLATFCLFIYDFYVLEISVEKLIDSFKEINDPGYRYNQTGNSNSFDSIIKDKILPFIIFEYIISFILGLISGRLIRIIGLDVRFKILRFKNYWFYLITGEYTRFNRLKHLKEQNKQLFLTKADVLIDSNSGSKLYSGIILDYELQHNDCNTLSKVYLFQAKRYSKDENSKMQTREIPGNILVVDCSNLLNINFTYVYKDKIINKKRREIVYVLFTVLYILIIPFFLYQIAKIDLIFYKNYFSFSVSQKFLFYLIILQSFHLCNPYRLVENDYVKVSFRFFIAKLAALLALLFAYWLFFLR